MIIKNFRPYITGNEIKYIKDIFDNHYDLAGDGVYTKKVISLLENKYKVKKALLTTSGTTALEFAVRLLNLNPGDEIIVPSFTFSSTANAVLLSFGLKVIFADVNKHTLNIDTEDIKRKITKKTKAIIVVHYAGVACDMDKIMKIAKENNLKVIEDAAQGIEAKYKDKYLGTIGDFGCISFHSTKNITSGEGGALFINSEDANLIENAEIVSEKGTNRTKFFRGEVDKYTWVDIGSSYLPSDMLAAFLLAQLEQADKIIQLRLRAYNKYYKTLLPLEKEGLIRLPKIPSYATHNAHIFYVILKTEAERDFVMKYLREKGISAPFHYIPLHSSPLGKKLGYKKDDMHVTENMSYRLIRLPLFSELNDIQINYVCKQLKDAIKAFPNRKLSLTVGIAAFNEEGNITHIIRDILNQKQRNFNLEKIIVNTDGSTDNTVRVVEYLSKKYPLVSLKKNKERKGKTTRLNEIYRLNKSDLLLTLDADIKINSSNAIDNMVLNFIQNEEAQVVAGNLVPISGNTLVGKIIFTNNMLWNNIRKNLNEGDHISNLYGSATMLRKEFADSLTYPEKITCDEEYLYIKAKEKNGFVFSKNSEFLFKGPDDFNEILLQGKRFLNERNQLVEYFGNEILNLHYVPTRVKIIETLKFLFKNPFYTSLLIIYNFFIKFYPVKTENSHLWSVAKSTKKLTY